MDDSPPPTDARWRWLRCCRIIARDLAELLELDGYQALLAFTAANPSTYLAAAYIDARPRTGVTQRLPAVESSARRTGQGGGEEEPTDALCVAVRAVRGGVTINGAHRLEPERAATAHLRFAAGLAASAGLRLCLSLVCAESEGAARLLLGWEADASLTAVSVADLSLFGCAALTASVRAGGPLRVLSGTTTVRLVASANTADSMGLRGMEALPSLEALCSDLGVPVRTLTSLRGMQSLRHISLPGALVADADVRLLAGIATLEEVCLDECGELTTLEPLALLPRLHRLSADECPRLLRVAGLAAAPRLRHLSLCGDLSLRAEEVGWLLAAAATLEGLSLTEAFLPAAPPPPPPAGNATPWLLSRLTALNLNRASLRSGGAWLARMPYLRQLRLSHSNVTEATLVEMAAVYQGGEDGSWQQVRPHLEVLTLDNCPVLHTSLAFARQLPLLAILSISAASVAAKNCVEELRACGKDIQIH